MVARLNVTKSECFGTMFSFAPIPYLEKEKEKRQLCRFFLFTLFFPLQHFSAHSDDLHGTEKCRARLAQVDRVIEVERTWARA